MKERFQVRLQTLIVSIVMPTLLLVIAAYGWSNYATVYSTILRGFDWKLEAVSATSAAFIDGDEHRRLIEPRDIRAVTLDTHADRLLGIDRGNAKLVALDRETGSAEELSDLHSSDPSLLAIRAALYQPARGSIIGLHDDGTTLVDIDPVNGHVRAFGRLREKAGAIALSPDGKSNFAAGEFLSHISSDGVEQKLIAKISLPGLQGLVAAESADELFGLDSTSGYLFRIHLRTGALKFVGSLVQNGNDQVPPAETSEDAQWVEPEIVTLPAHALIFDRSQGQLYAVTDRLLRVSSESGAANPSGFRAAFRSDTSALYRKYAAPMHRIMNELGLTYHYTLILPERGKQIYVLDATEGEDHSAAGTEEEVDSEEWTRLSEVLRSGQSSRSEIKQFDIWGLLKVGTAAIRDSRGYPVALAGADVNISVIHGKTRTALLQLLAIGAVSLLFAGLASIFIAKRLMGPVSKLKDGALQVAAGYFTRAVEVRRPSELRRLAAAFDEVRTNLRDRIATLKEENDRFEVYRRRRALTKIFAGEDREDTGSRSFALGKTITTHLLGENGKRRESSGWVESGSQVLLWIAESPVDALQAVRLRSDIGTICRSLLEKYGSDWSALECALQPLFVEQVSVFVLLDASTGIVRSIARRQTAAMIVSPQRACDSCLLLEHPAMQLSPGQSFVISSRQNGNARREQDVQELVNGEPQGQQALEPELCAVMRWV